MTRQLRIQYEGAVYYLMSRAIGARKSFAMIWTGKAPWKRWQNSGVPENWLAGERLPI